MRCGKHSSIIWGRSSTTNGRRFGCTFLMGARRCPTAIKPQGLAKNTGPTSHRYEGLPRTTNLPHRGLPDRHSVQQRPPPSLGAACRNTAELCPTTAPFAGNGLSRHRRTVPDSDRALRWERLVATPQNCAQHRPPPSLGAACRDTAELCQTDAAQFAGTACRDIVIVNETCPSRIGQSRNWPK